MINPLIYQCFLFYVKLKTYSANLLLMPHKKPLNLIKKCLSVISREFFSHDISRIVLVELLESAGLLSQTWPWKSAYSCLNMYHISESARTWTPVTTCGFRGWIFFYAWEKSCSCCKLWLRLRKKICAFLMHFLVDRNKRDGKF